MGRSGSGNESHCRTPETAVQTALFRQTGPVNQIQDRGYSAVASAAESSMNNTNVAHKTTEKVNSWLHAIANQKVYADSIISKTIKALILNHKNETFMTEDAFDVINTKKTENTDESSLDSEKLSQK